MPHTNPLLSRVADAVYWLGRYIERAENVVRFLDVHHNLTLDLPQEFAGQWQPIVDITGDRAVFLERYVERARHVEVARGARERCGSLSEGRERRRTGEVRRALGLVRYFFAGALRLQLHCWISERSSVT